MDKDIGMEKMKQTSLDAYEHITPELQKKEEEVLEAFRELGGSATNAEVANHLGVFPNNVTGRTNSLVKKGLLEEGESRKCNITGYKAIEWKLKG